jgi:hypothetical protein
MKFCGNPQVQLHIKGVVVSDEGTSIGSPSFTLEDRSFNFNKAKRFQVATNARSDLSAAAESLPTFGLTIKST